MLLLLLVAYVPLVAVVLPALVEEDEMLWLRRALARFGWYQMGAPKEWLSHDDADSRPRVKAAMPYLAAIAIGAALALI